MTKAYKTICLFDSWNYSYNLGQKHAIYIPHFEPDEAYFRERKEMYPDWTWDGIHHPEYEINCESFWEDVQEFDKTVMLDYIGRCKKGQLVGILVTGHLGLWNGNPAVYPTLCFSLKEAITKCVSGMDDYRVDICNGVITCYGYHHDGTNVFTLRGASTTAMSDAQIEELGEAGCRYPPFEHTHDKLFVSTKRHLRKINFLKEMGWMEKHLKGVEA